MRISIHAVGVCSKSLSLVNTPSPPCIRQLKANEVFLKFEKKKISLREIKFSFLTAKGFVLLNRQKCRETSKYVSH